MQVKIFFGTLVMVPTVKVKTNVWILGSGSLATAQLPASLRLFSAVIDVGTDQMQENGPKVHGITHKCLHVPF